MTAEIALLNRRALAFAADSAVTISDGQGKNKIYNSAEKIFEISIKRPIGLMLYNTMDFVGVPIDVLARQFRSERDDEFATCQDVCASFLDFLRGYKHTIEDERSYLSLILTSELKDTVKEHEEALQRVFLADALAGRQSDPQQTYRQLTLDIIRKHSEDYRSRPLENFLDGISREQFVESYGIVSIVAIGRTFPMWAADAEVTQAVQDLAFSIVRSAILSRFRTGLVFGGYGTNDLFPSLHAVEVDGLYFGQLKTIVYRSVDIDRRGERSAIVPFAQSEMVERFLVGMDSELENNLHKYLAESQGILEQRLSTSQDTTVSSTFKSVDIARGVADLLRSLKAKAHSETLDMVESMPKQELAYSAEAFVTLTSMKRKVSFQQETVGGPVDVAVITKNEGFVWIKRKHYFDLERNPRYAVRAAFIRGGGHA